MQPNEATAAKESVLETDEIYRHYKPILRLLRIRKTITGACGFNLTRTKWDPYPWVNAVDAHTAAEMSGLKPGDCVLEVNGEDVLGLRITDIAKLVQAKSGHVTLLLWSCGSDFKCDPESICCAPMPRTLQRLATIVQAILSIIECPVCLDTIAPPVMQCQNGHLLCLNCRIRAEKCPICRDRYTPQRALIAEQIYAAITNAYNLCNANEDKLRQKLFGANGRTEASMRVTNSRRMRRAEAAKQTIEDDQLTEAGEERLQMKKRWRSQKQIRKEQCQSLHVVGADDVPTGRFGYVKDADADTTVVLGGKTSKVTAKHETKRKKILMKLWNGKAASMENCYSTSWAEKIKQIKSGQQNSRVIDTYRDGNEMHGETIPVIGTQIMARLPTQTLQYISKRADSKKYGSEGEELVTQVLHNHTTLHEANNSNRNKEDTEEEAITNIKTDTTMTMRIQMQMGPLTMPLNCAPTNKTILNDAATNNVAHVNVMSKRLTSPAIMSTTNDLPATWPSRLPPLQQQQQEVCKNNETAAETVMHNGKRVSQRQQHVQPQRQLCTWQQQQHLTGHKKCEDSVLSATPSPTAQFSTSTTTIACGCCSQQSQPSDYSSSFENCRYSSSLSLALEDKRRYASHPQSSTAKYSNKCFSPAAATNSLPPADCKKYWCSSNATGSCSASTKKGSNCSSSTSNSNNSCCIIDSSHFFNSTTASSQSSGICCSSMDPNDYAVTTQQCEKQQHGRSEDAAITPNKNASLSYQNSSGWSSSTASLLHTLPSVT